MMRKIRSRKAQFPCGTCKKECEESCLFCEVCDAWFHSTCEQISKADFKTWTGIKGEYICRQCRLDDDNFDYLRGITRLMKATAGGISALREAVTRESLLLGTDKLCKAQETPLIAPSVDIVSSSILKQYHTTQGKPLLTTGDGDCLFNAVSILMYGNELKSVELRYKTAVMMIEEEASIVKHKDRANIMLLSPDYVVAALECVKIGAFSSTWTVIALSRVIDRPLRVLYPSINGGKDLAFKALNTTYSSDTQGEPLTIMWTSINKLSVSVVKKKSCWTPNHFVAVIEQPEESVVETTYPEIGIPQPLPKLSPSATSRTVFEEAPASEIAIQQTQSSPEAKHQLINSSIVLEEALVKPETSNHISSTPKQDEWQVPKRRRLSSQYNSPPSVNLSNRFQNLSTDEEDNLLLLSDGDSISPNPYVTGKTKRKRKRRSLSPVRARDISNEQLNSSELSECVLDISNKQQLYSSELSERSFIENDKSDGESGNVPWNDEHRGKIFKFLPTHTIMELFKDSEGSLPSIPSGIKENMYFIIDNSENEIRQKSGLRREFWDDCGAWEKSTSPATYFIEVENKLINITKRHGKYCVEKYGRNFEILDPQPEQSELIIINRSYSKLKANALYKRRISWIGNRPESHSCLQVNIAIVEYTGTFPGRGLHGKVKHSQNKQPYIKSKLSLKRKAQTMVQHDSAKNVHDELNQGSDLHELPRNLKQIQNMKYNSTKRSKREGDNGYLKNLADHLIHIENEVYNGHPFIRSVNHLHTGASVIMYTDEQIQDIRRFCCRDHGSILGVDKTYNLGQLHLTTTVFKNLAVNRTDTGESPVFLGPSFLHGKSDFETFNVFFTNIASHFKDEEIEKLVIGSDDEVALRKSLKRSFPNSTQVVCTRHLKNNVKDYLSKKVGVNEKDKQDIVKSLFGENGLTDANSTIVFEHRLNTINSNVELKAEGFKPYLENRIIPMIKNQVNLPSRLKKMDADWTNNNAESMNNLLKIGTNHKVEDMADLIDIIHRMVKSMYKDCEKALVRMGNYRLKDSYEHLTISIDTWCQKNTSEQKSYLQRFYKDKGRNNRTVTSTNGNLTVPKTPNGGKKPYQRKRMAAERTAPRK